MRNSISISMHIGSGKNAINNLEKIKRCDLHNNRKYKNNKNQEIHLTLSKYNITLVGTKNILKDIKKFYQDEFKEAVYNYNQKQPDERRKIDNYLNKISNDNKTNIAVEFIFQIGDKEDWEEESLEDKQKTAEIFKKVIPILEKKGIKVVNASLHLDETSPHLHIIAVPIIEGQKRGLEKQVSQNKVITKNAIKVIRKEVEETLLKKYNEVYGTDKELKKGSEIEEHLSVEDYKDTKKIIEITQKLGNKKEFIRKLDIDLTELDEDIKNLGKEIITKKEEFAKLTRVEKEIETVIKRMQEKIKRQNEVEKELEDSYNKVSVAEEKIKKNDEILLEYTYKINNFDQEVENKKQEIEKKQKEKAEEQEKLEKIEKETAEITVNRINADNILLQIKEKEKTENEKKVRLEKLRENELKLDATIEVTEKNIRNKDNRISDLENSIKEKNSKIDELEAEEKKVEKELEKQVIKRDKRIELEKEKELEKIIEIIDEIHPNYVYNHFSKLGIFDNDKDPDDFRNLLSRFFRTRKNEIAYYKKQAEELEEEFNINEFLKDEIFEEIKKVNKEYNDRYGNNEKEQEISR